MRQELAGAYAVAGRTDAAFAELVAGLLVNPAHAALHAALGQLRLDAGQPERAIPAFTRALELSPARYEVRYALATALSRSGNAAAAAQQLTLFERERRQRLEQRRHDIEQDVEREDAIRRGLANPGGTP
jgi:Flp pilus assembly protein TadD